MVNTSISISKSTFDALKALTEEGSTIEDTIVKLIVHYIETKEFPEEHAFYNDGDIITYEYLKAQIAKSKRELTR